MASFKMAAVAPMSHFVQLYPQPLYTASQVRTTSRLWDKGVLTDMPQGVLTDICLTLYIRFSITGFMDCFYHLVYQIE
jgi:hypothetical protein